MLSQEFIDTLVTLPGDGGEAGPAPSEGVASAKAGTGLSVEVITGSEPAGILYAVVGFVKGTPGVPNPYVQENSAEQHAQVPGTKLIIAPSMNNASTILTDPLEGFVHNDLVHVFGCTASSQADIDVLTAGGVSLRKVKGLTKKK